MGNISKKEHLPIRTDVLYKQTRKFLQYYKHIKTVGAFIVWYICQNYHCSCTNFFYLWLKIMLLRTDQFPWTRILLEWRSWNQMLPKGQVIISHVWTNSLLSHLLQTYDEHTFLQPSVWIPFPSGVLHLFSEFSLPKASLLQWTYQCKVQFQSWFLHIPVQL